MSSARRIVLCLDGTWNNAYQRKQRDDGSKVVKPSNPLKMARAVLPHDPDSGTCQISYYDTGVGALGDYPGPSNRMLGLSDRVLGGAWGAGFEANIEQAATFLAHNYREGDSAYVFGFSRGAAQARGLTQFLDWMRGLPTKRDAYFIPLFFSNYVRSSGTANPDDTKTATGKRPSEPLQKVPITLLGVWDTVMALGSRFRATEGTSEKRRSFHVGSRPAKCVLNARQALAIDEQRYDFRPEIWGGAGEEQTVEQRWFPGVHSNVGGGYVEDGLANLSFRWLLGEAEKLGLATDSEFTKHYRPYPQARQHTSETKMYRVLEAVRFRRGKGVRSVTGHPEGANLDLDKSVIHRMISDPADPNFDQLEQPYRPKNVLGFLAAKPDLAKYLASIEGLKPEHRQLPPDVQSKLVALT